MEYNPDTLSRAKRWLGSIATIVAMLFLLVFFARHQTLNTGFFTSKFGMGESLALYFPILLSFGAPIARAMSGRQNSARPFDAATNLSLGMGSLWLAIVFPFDFAHLTDSLPYGFRILFSWITDDVGRFVLILQVIIGLIAAPVQLFTFFSIRRHATATH